MKKLLLFFSMLLSFGLAAQDTYQLSNAIDFFRNNQIAKGELKSLLTEADISGSPYLNDEFITGDIYTTSKTQYTGIPLRYNIYNDEMQFKSPEDKIAAIGAPETIDKVVFGEFTMAYIPYINLKKIRRGYFKVVVDGKAKLYARPNIEYRQAVPAAAYKDPEPAKFLEKPDSYYIRIGLDAAQLIEKKKDLETIFPDHQKEIMAFIKKNKINHRNPDKLKELVEYYNSL